ncbi:MAG: HU family DNA-binding protein [Muribaculaceae bacterium]|nr:HU family DNA-binding protein [Muribaculaceae bacterium]
MNNKITLPALIAQLALKTGMSQEESEKFFSEFFNLLITTLAEGETVRIKALGTFKVTEVEPRRSVDVSSGREMVIPGHRKISFIPTRELAAEINAPFEMFESVELHPEALAILESESRRDNQSPEERSDEEEHPVEDKSTLNVESPLSGDLNPIDKEEPQEVIKITEAEKFIYFPEAEEKDIDSEKESDDVGSEESQDEAAKEERFVEDMEQTMKKSRKRGFILGLLYGLLIAILVIAGLYWFWFRDFYKTRLMETTEPEMQIAPADSVAQEDGTTIASTDSVKEGDTITEMATGTIAAVDAPTPAESEAAPTQPSDSPVYDTITETRYLTTMAQAHYGNFNLWPYIYEENKAILGHPDRIRPGTRVVIPPLSKYKVNPDNPEEIKKAKRLGVAIYKKWGGKPKA